MPRDPLFTPPGQAKKDPPITPDDPGTDGTDTGTGGTGTDTSDTGSGGDNPYFPPNYFEYTSQTFVSTDEIGDGIVTTYAVGEEADDDPVATTLAIGEESDDRTASGDTDPLEVLADYGDFSDLFG